jgi:hypothetical protein
VADNPFELKHFGLLAALGAEPRRNSLLDYVTPPSPKPEPSPLARAVADLLMDKPTPALPVSPCPYASGLGNSRARSTDKTAIQRLGHFHRVAIIIPTVTPGPSLRFARRSCSSSGAIALQRAIFAAAETQAGRACDEAQGVFQLSIRRHHAREQRAECVENHPSR